MTLKHENFEKILTLFAEKYWEIFWPIFKNFQLIFLSPIMMSIEYISIWFKNPSHIITQVEHYSPQLTATCSS